MSESEIPKTPEWLNKKFLESVIRQYKNDNSITVIEFSFNGTFSDHFASSMFRISIEFNLKQSTKNESINVVVKAQPADEGVVKEVTAGLPLFETEISMYSKTLPMFMELYKAIGVNFYICPEIVYISDDPFSVIILLDLSLDGFTVLKESPSELEDSKLIFEKLAKFHAASYHLAENNNVDFTNYNKCIYQSEMILETFTRDAMRAFRETLEEWEGCEKYYDKIDWLIENAADVGKKCYIPNKPGHGYNVLNHGDFHMKNMLMKKNNDKHIEDFCFVSIFSEAIDYQCCVWCSPVVDISYFFGIIKRPDAGTLDNNELVMHYHQEFVKALEQLGSTKPPPTLLDLNVELLQHGAINTLIWICMLPFSYIDLSTFDAKDIMGQDRERTHAFKKTLYNNPIYKELILNEMNSWIAKGWL